MDNDFIRGVILVFLTCISVASLVFSNENKKTGTCCSDGLGLNYTLPMFNECKKEQHPNGSMVQTIPKLIPYTSPEGACPRRKSKLGIPPGHRMCRFPACAENTCQNGWCEETMKNFKCHCSAGYRGKLCNKQSTSTQDTPKMSTTESTTCRPTTTTLTTPILPTVTTTSPAAALSSLYSTMTATFSALISSTSLPFIAPTTPDVTTDVPTINTPVQASTNGDSSSAPPSYEGKQYGFSNAFTTQTFEDARQDCTAFVPDSASDSGLIELTDAEEKAFITGYVSTMSIPNGSSLWIGCPKYLSGDPKHGFYCYHSDYRYSRKNNLNHGYWDWDTSEPQLNDRRCMVLNLATHKYRAEYCDSTAAIALCEWSP